jgi:hypothetical protein
VKPARAGCRCNPVVCSALSSSFALLIPLLETLMARSSTAARTHVPLGSLTQRGARTGAGCRACGSERVTRIAMSLTDGSPVQFTSCHRCEHRTWEEQGSEGGVLPVDRVLDKTRKI